MGELIRMPYAVASRRIISAMLRRGLLQWEERNDPDAIERALQKLIARDDPDSGVRNPSPWSG
jgi:hypothetical protein